MFNLNNNQKIATLHNCGPMMVLSGPGSGKTTVITHRVKNLIENLSVPPQNILVITFTKSASIDMKERFEDISTSKYPVTFATFHSHFFKIIRNHYKYKLTDIIHDKERRAVINAIIMNKNIPFDNKEDFLQNILNEISFVKNELIPCSVFESSSTTSDNFHIIYNLYEEYKEKSNKIDFDDMQTKCYELLKSEPHACNFWKNTYQYILIDEFQDINKVQYECIKMLISDKNNIFVVGDDDQSIYGFRGSNPDFLLNFPKDFVDTKQTILDINYRSTNEIISLCNTIISDNIYRYKKNIIGTDISYKTPIMFNTYGIQEEAQKVAQKIKSFKDTYTLNEIAIIYRTNIQARAIVVALMDNNINYQIKDNFPSIYEHFIAKDIISYLRLATDPLDNTSFINIANKPKRYLNKSYLSNALRTVPNNESLLKYLYCNSSLKHWQVENLQELNFNLEKLVCKTPYDAIKYILNVIDYNSYLEEYAVFKRINSKGFADITNELLESSKGYKTIEDYLLSIENAKKELSENINNSDGVMLSTIHSVKGLEFDVVFVIGCIDGVIPHEKSKSQFAIEEERRLFYVALTRAKKLLFISVTKTKYESNAIPSRFLNKLIKKRR